MKILVCVSGTRGDVHPLVGIATTLRQRGHEVILLANPAFAPLAEEAGIGFAPIGTAEELAATKRHPKIWDYQHSWKLWIHDAGLTPMPELFVRIEELHSPGETVVIASYLCFGARVAQEKLGIPTATVHLNVHTIRSVHNIYAMPSPTFLPKFEPTNFITNPNVPVHRRRRRMWVSDKLFFEPYFARRIKKFRCELGLPKLRQMIRDWWNSPDLAIGLFPDWWAGEHPDWPSQLVTTSFPFWDRSGTKAMSDELRQFLEKEPVIVYSPGASGGHTEAHFQTFENVCRTLDRRGLILTPKPPKTISQDSRVRYESYIPFKSLLQRTTLVIHHAGIGTTAQCLAAGCPQLTVPSVYNTPDTARRLERLGVSRTVTPDEFDSSKVSSAAGDLLTSEDVTSACRRYSEALSNQHPLPEIAGLVESLC